MKIAGTLCVAITVLALVACAPTEPEQETPTLVTGLENGSFSANLNGFDIHYEVHGKGPVLMTLPNSWGLSLEGLRGMYAPLEERLTMVYFDPRGMGSSSPIVEESDMGLAAVRADFIALKEHLGLGTVSAIGWSNGAMNLIYLASENPGSIEAAIFVHGVAKFGQEEAAEMAERFPEMVESNNQFQKDVQRPELTDAERTAMLRSLWFDEWFPLSTGDPANAGAMFDATFGTAQLSWPHADYTNRTYPEFDARDALSAITARCLVIAGAHDMMTVEGVEALHEGLADSEFLVFESSGHFAPVEEPQAFKQAVFFFLGIK